MLGKLQGVRYKLLLIIFIVEQLIKKTKPVFKGIKLWYKIIFLLSSLLLLHVSCNRFKVSEKSKKDTLYIYGYFYPRERFHIVINGETVFDSTMSQIEYFEWPVAFTSKSSNQVECNLSYKGQKGITRKFYIADTTKEYRVIVPIGVPLGYQQLDTTKPPPFDEWKNLSPDSLQREIKLDFKGRLSNY